MDYRKELLNRVDQYCSLTGMSRATIATKVMNDGKFFKRIGEGKGCTMKTFERVMKWFDENMPVSAGRVELGVLHKSPKKELSMAQCLKA